MNERDQHRDDHAADDRDHLDARLGLDPLAGAEVPDQWDEIVRRAGEPVSVVVDQHTRRPRTPVWLAAAAAVAVAVVGGIVLLAPDDGSIRTSVTQSTAPDGSGPTTAPSVPPTTEPDDATTPTTTPATTPTTGPAVVPAPDTSDPATGSSVPAPTAPATTAPVPAGMFIPTLADVDDVALAASPRWAVACTTIVGEPGSAPDSEDVGPFDVLAPSPSLRVDVPTTGPASESESLFSSDSVATVKIDVVPGGVAVVAKAPWVDDEPSLPSIVSVVDRDGTVRWRRCVDADTSDVFVGPPEQSPAVAYVGGGGQVVALSLDTGELVPIDAALDGVDLSAVADRYAVLADSRTIGPGSEMRLLDGLTGQVESLPPVPDEFVEGEHSPRVDTPAGAPPIVSFQRRDNSSKIALVDGSWTADPDTLAGALPVTLRLPEVGLVVDDGANRPVLTIDGYVHPQREGFWAITDGETIIADDCVSVGEFGCERERFVAYDATTGTELWSQDGGGTVAFMENDRALAIGGALGDKWVFIDPRTGEPVDETRWAALAFGTECCGGDVYTYASHQGGVAWHVDWSEVEVYWRPELSESTSTVDLADDPAG